MQKHPLLSILEGIKLLSHYFSSILKESRGPSLGKSGGGAMNSPFLPWPATGHEGYPMYFQFRPIMHDVSMHGTP